MSAASPRIAVYTVAVDRTGPLPPVPESPGTDFFCFFRGESPPLAEGWELVALDGFPELDGPRLSRLPKTLPHLFLPRHKASVYIDSSVHLKDDFLEMVLAREAHVSLSMVQLTRNLGEEFDAVATRRYDSLYHLAEQLESYGKFHPDFRQLQSFWGGLIVRNHFDEDVIDFGFRWALNVMRFSRRDQLSLPIALSNFPSGKFQRIQGSDEESSLHVRLVGNSKPRNYSLGDEFAVPRKDNFAISREELYLAEIRSLRKLLGSRIFDTVVRYLRRP
jgi:hypothetical protein